MRFLKDYSNKALYDLIKYAIIAVSPWLFSHFSQYIPFVNKYTPLQIGITISILIVICFISYRIFLFGKKKLSLLDNSGIFYFGKNSDSKDKNKNEELLKDKLKKAKSIEIIGATGFNTFARNDVNGKAILREALENAIGEINILLMDPTTRQARMRATCLSVPFDKYQNEILNSVMFLKEIRNRGKNINLKFYSQRPIWKMIILDDFLWLQYYHNAVHVENMPVYGISRIPGKGNFNLFDPLYAVFQKKWLHDNNPTFDFSTDEIVYDGTPEIPAKRIKIHDIIQQIK